MGNTFRGGRDQPHRKVIIQVGTKEGPALSFQCFERRHSECHGIVGFLGDKSKCECGCHGVCGHPNTSKDGVCRNCKSGRGTRSRKAVL